MKKFLSACRYLLMIPVLGCVIMTGGVVIMAFGRIITAVKRLFEIGWFSPDASKVMTVAVIEIIDVFLVGTVSYIVAIGLYKLFISNEEIQLPMKLKINTLTDLEDKIIGVIIAALAVSFLGRSASGVHSESLLQYGGGIALIIVALTFFIRGNSKNKTQNKEEEEN